MPSAISTNLRIVLTHFILPTSPPWHADPPFDFGARGASRYIHCSVRVCVCVCVCVCVSVCECVCVFYFFLHFRHALLSRDVVSRDIFLILIGRGSQCTVLCTQPRRIAATALANRCCHGCYTYVLMLLHCCYTVVAHINAQKYVERHPLPLSTHMQTRTHTVHTHIYTCTHTHTHTHAYMHTYTHISPRYTESPKTWRRQ
jgi:hypothetical protein